ncbi:MAG: acetoin utilization protein AcuC [Bacillota bacterium]
MKAAYIHSERFLAYRFGKEHPFNPLRLELARSLMADMGLLFPREMILPRPASQRLLRTVHSPQYVNIVRRLGQGEKMDASLFGLGTEDNPVFPDMHRAGSLVVGATIRACAIVARGLASHAVNLAGGLHHAHRACASGFCIYNDISVGIRLLRKHYRMRVAYVDLDAHHGDGVQWEFYDDPDVLTLSIHESGRYLFPGSGGIHELGEGRGVGYSVNVPLEPFTDDESWIYCFDSVVPRLLSRFCPDIIVLQFGCDAHYLDPLSHLSLTSTAFIHAARSIHQLSHRLCAGRLVVLGGGGYDIFSVVPRIWTLLWAELSDRIPTPDTPHDWRARWRGISPVPLPVRLRDENTPKCQMPVYEVNRLTVARLLDSLHWL